MSKNKEIFKIDLTPPLDIKDILRVVFQILRYKKAEIILDGRYLGIFRTLLGRDFTLEIYHIPVMVKEVLEYVKPGVIVDATAGTGGHLIEMIKKFKNSFFIAIEKDPNCFEILRKRFLNYSFNLRIYNTSYTNLGEILKDYMDRRVDTVLFDLGINIYHVEFSGRGFSYNNENEDLDMRFNPDEGEPAWVVLKKGGFELLKNIFIHYGELSVKDSERFVKLLLEERKRREIKKVGDLNKLIKKIFPGRYLKSRMKIYQALRIYVNKELDEIVKGFSIAVENLRIGGRLIILSYHSLEDRIAKCLGRVVGLESLTKTPILPSQREVMENKRARSAKMRVYEKKREINAGKVFSVIANCAYLVSDRTFY